MGEVSFARKEYIVTDIGCQVCLCLTCPLHFMSLVPGIHGSKRIILEEEEAVYEVKCGICNVDTRRPYGELGSVDKGNCLCCVGVSSELTKGAPINIGWGCENEAVDEIVSELKKRMKERGDTGQIKKAEKNLEEIQKLQVEVSEMKKDMKLLLAHFNITAPTEYYSEMERM